MIKRQTDQQHIQKFNYTRNEFHSNLLKQNFHCGFMRQLPPEQISKTIYLLHGGGADDTQAVQIGLLPVLSQVFGNHPEVQIVLPFIGNNFLHDHPTIPEKSYSKYFTNELLTACENGTLTNSGGRFISGWSMGGQAALNMFLRNPDEFAGVGAHFPTLIEFDYNDPLEASGYAARHKITDEHLKTLVSDFKMVFVDKNDFQKHDPLTLTKGLTPNHFANKKVYFDVGLSDEFGLQEGAQVLDKIMTAMGVSHRFEAIPGGKHDGSFIHSQIAKLMNYLIRP